MGILSPSSRALPQGVDGLAATMVNGAMVFQRRLPIWMLAVAVSLAVVTAAPVAHADSARTLARFERISDKLVDQGKTFLSQQKYDDARKRFEEAIVANPRNATAFSYLGYTQRKLGSLAVAKKYFATALEIDPEEVRALSWGGEADLTAADLEGAEAKLQKLARACGPNCSEYRTLSDAISTYKTANPKN